jgi:Na+/H+ antiporter NhaC
LAPNKTLEGPVEYALRWILPFAVAAVAVVLVFGLINMLRGENPNLSQKLMRARVLLQLVALLIVMAIVYLAGQRGG